jgi:hypothetical protein
MVLAGVAALGVTALHLITTRRPPSAPLPTARFVPGADARSAARAERPTDLPLLALRALAILALGAAFAGLEISPGGAMMRRVVVVDRSRAATAAVRDSALGAWREGDALVLVDSAATVIGAGAADSLHALAATGARGELSAGLAAAWRAAATVTSSADSLELVLISPFAADEFDAATAALAASWPGRLRTVRTPVAVPSAQRVELRVSATVADSALARGGVAIVVWPSLMRASGSAAVPAAQAATRATVTVRPNGVATDDAVLVAPLSVAPVAGGGLVVARWANGEPAAVERAAGDGCLRDVGIGVPAAGDVTLQPAFRAIARALFGPCAARTTSPGAPASRVQSLERRGAAAPATQFRERDHVPDLTAWLLAAAFLLLAGELALRRASAEIAS